SAVESSSTVWVAPNCLKSRAVELIDREISFGSEGYIGLKLNSLTDRDIIEKLAQASKSGVKIELLIRGISCIIAGIEGETENIRLVSVVGRFLEHSRIYIFGKGERERVYISSADFMTRNTERRVEAAAPIKDPTIKKRITDYFRAMLRDNVKARDQQSDGTYLRRSYNEDIGEEPFDAQIYFYKKAYEEAENAARPGREREGERERAANPDRPAPVKVQVRRITKKKEAGKETSQS
ncbi:MAG: phospholipase D-like domain-containing protein, partial [Eubacterium sp.]|nr:phospholipase D-like domain-containing protein [Eubacterium sp.]